MNLGELVRLDSKALTGGVLRQHDTCEPLGPIHGVMVPT